MQLEKKGESKVLDRSYVEVYLEGKAGQVSRKDAIAAVAQELKVPPENVGLVRMEGQSGTTRVLARLHVYGSADSKKRVHPRYLDERMLTKEEKEKLKQDKKKVPAAAPAGAKK